MTEETKTTKKTPKTVALHDGVSVKVRSGFYGKLYFKNPRSGEPFAWSGAGDVQFMTVGDLKTMKAQCPGYFRNNWLIILGCADGEECTANAAEICKYLAIDHYYKDYIDPASFTSVCEWSEAEIAERVPMLAEGAKQNLTVALKGFIENGTLDSRRKIKAFEKALGCNLLED